MYTAENFLTDNISISKVSSNLVIISNRIGNFLSSYSSNLVKSSDCNWPIIDLKLFNEEYYFKTISKKYKNTKYFKKNFIFNKFDYPKIFDLSFIDIHNCIITSSVMIERELLIDVGMFDPTLKNGVGDYDCWLKVLEYTNCDYISDPLFYYDGSHGQGQNYK